MQALKSWGKNLVIPHPDLKQPAERRNARMLAIVYLIVLIVGTLLAIVNALSATPAVRESHLKGSVVTLAVVLACYGLARTRHYLASVFVFCLGFSLMVLFSIISNTSGYLLPVYLVVPVLLVGAFGNLRMATAVGGINLLLMVFTVVLVQNAASQNVLISSIQFYVLMTTMTLLMTRHRNRMEENRRKQLSENEARLRSYFDEANDWIFTLNNEGLITSVNTQMCTASGYSASELIGHYPADFLTPESLPGAMAMLQQIFAGKNVDRFEAQVQLRNGQSAWLEIRGRAFVVDGKVVETLHIARDVTERKLAEEAEREQRLLAETLQETAAALNSTLDLDQVMDKVLDLVARVVPHDVSEILLINEGNARVVRHRGYEQFGATAAIEALQLPIGATPNLQQMFATQEPVVIADRKVQADWIPIKGLEWARAFAGTPIVRNGRCLGFLHVGSLQVDAFKMEHAWRLQAFAEHVSNALHNARLYETMQKQRDVAETLRQAAAVLNSTLALDEVLAHILEQLGLAISFDSASVHQRRRDGMHLLAVTGFPEPDKLKNEVIPIEPKYPNANLLNLRSPLAFADVTEAFPHFQDQADRYQSGRIRSWLGVPLLIDDRLLGIVTVDRNEVRPFTEEEIEVAKAFANHAAIALHNADLYEQVKRHNETLETAVRRRTRALERTVNQNKAILNNSPDGILFLSPLLEVHSSNPTFEQMFDVNQDQACERFPQCISDPATVSRILRAFRLVLDTGQRTRLEFTARRHDQTTFDADMALAPLLQQNEVIGIICSIRDISDLKELARAKDAFVSNVSHELRTPIASLQLNYDLIRLNPQKQPTYLERIGREIVRLDTLIEDLLQLSRLDQERVEWQFEDVDLSQFVQQFVMDREPIARERGIALTYQTVASLPPIPADAKMLGQVLGILLTNALNYTPPGGSLAVSTQSHFHAGQQWGLVSIQDSGPGIQPDELPHIFDRFYRGRAGQDSGQPGTGLGLAIAKEIIIRHQGEIKVESSLDAGTIFTVWLPVVSQLDSEHVYDSQISSGENT